MQEAAGGSKQLRRPYLTSFLSSEKSPTCWGAEEEHVLSWQLQPHVLEWKKLGCLQAASCQAFRVTLRGPVCAFGFQDECGPGRETPHPPHLRGSLSLPGSVPWAEWGKQELTAREGGKWHYISLQKRRLACHVNGKQMRGQPQRQCSLSWAAAVAWGVVSEQQGQVRERVSGARNCRLGVQPLKESFGVTLSRVCS